MVHVYFKVPGVIRVEVNSPGPAPGNIKLYVEVDKKSDTSKEIFTLIYGPDAGKFDGGIGVSKVISRYAFL